MINIEGFDHVALNVRDLDKSLEFYTNVLSLKITEREPSKPGIEYFLDCGPSLLGIIQAKDLSRELATRIAPLAPVGVGGQCAQMHVAIFSEEDIKVLPDLKALDAFW